MAMTRDPSLNGTALARLRRIGGASLVRQMVDLYLAGGPARVQAIAEGAAAGDATRVERAAHALKSSAGNIGAEQLQHTADALEALAAEGNIDMALVARLVREYDESADALARALEEQPS